MSPPSGRRSRRSATATAAAAPARVNPPDPFGRFAGGADPLLIAPQAPAASRASQRVALLRRMVLAAALERPRIIVVAGKPRLMPNDGGGKRR